MDIWKRLFKLKHRNFRSKKAKYRFLLLATAVLVTSIYAYTSTVPKKIDPQAYTPLLNTIAKGESRGNYNAYFGRPDNAEIQFTQMSVGEVLQWQENFVKSGQPSSAVGKYQFIRPTLAGLVKQKKLNPDTKFDEKMQDELAITLLERRGSIDYVNDKISREEFAANIAQEWAALPKIKGPNPDESYYAGDGLNKSRVNKDDVFKALHQLKS